MPEVYSVQDEINMEAWAVMLPLLQEFADTHDKNIYAINPHNEVWTPAHALERIEYFKGYYGMSWPLPGDNDLIFLFWSSSLSPMEVDHWPSYLFGERTLQPGVEGPSLKQETSSGVIPFMDDSGNIWGSLVEGRFVYFGFDVPHTRRKAPLWLEKMLPHISMVLSGGSYDEIIARAKELRRERALAEYIKVCQLRNKAKSESAQAKAQMVNESLNTIRQSLQNALREAKDAQLELEAARIQERKARPDNERFEREFNVLSSNAKIEDIRVPNGEGSIEIRTVPLVTEWLEDGTKRKLGKYSLVFNTVNSYGPYVRALEQLSTRGWPHPHIRGDNDACWGNFSTAVAQLYAEHEYAALTDLVIKFLENPNVHDDWGAAIFEWPIEDMQDGSEPFHSYDEWVNRNDEEYDDEEEYDEDYDPDYAV